MPISPPPLKVQQLSNVMEQFLGLDSNMPVIQALIFLFVASRDLAQGVGPTGQDISEALKLDASRVSRNLARLAEAGLIERERGDMGVKRNTITKTGRKYLDRLTNLIQ
jgi:DNA-binding MarR family transcriptional regulator